MPQIRKAMVLALDNKAFADILSQGNDLDGAVMLPPPAGFWGMPKEMLPSLLGHAPDIEKSRAEARKIMEGLGYGPDKPLKIKVATRNIAIYRDPAVILIDQLKQIYIEGELEPIDTTVWYTKIQRKDYQVGMNLTGVGIDDPDVNFYENYYSTSDRNYTGYKNPEVDKLIDQQSAEADREKRKKLVWEIEKKLADDVGAADHGLQRRQHLLDATGQGHRAAGQQHLQRLAFRRRLARQVDALRRHLSESSEALSARFSGGEGQDETEAERLMGSYLVRRFLLMVLTLFGMSVLIFVMLRLVPGNIADILVDAAGIADPKEKAKIVHELGPRPADHRAVRPVDRRPVARRSRLRLCLGAAGHRGDRAAHPDQRQARRHGAVLCRPYRRAVRRHQRGAAEHAARLLPARAQSQRPVVALVLARPAGADGGRPLVRHDSRSTATNRAASCRRSACWPFRRPWWASAARR